jgi:hypothetical protein
MAASSSEEEEEPAAPAAVLSRGVRANRGSRMNSLIGEEEDADEAFWGQDFFKEEEEVDEEYEAEEEQKDVFDKDFDDSESEERCVGCLFVLTLCAVRASCVCFCVMCVVTTTTSLCRRLVALFKPLSLSHTHTPTYHHKKQRRRRRG